MDSVSQSAVGRGLSFDLVASPLYIHCGDVSIVPKLSTPDLIIQKLEMAYSPYLGLAEKDPVDFLDTGYIICKQNKPA